MNVSSYFEDFVSHLAAGQHKPQRRLVRDLLAGVTTSGSVLLSEIGRSLEEPVRLRYTEKRLSRGLLSPRLDVALIQERYLGRIEPFLRRCPNLIVSVDTSDLQKPFARSMPHLWTVRDGDAPGSEVTKGPGYEMATVEAVLGGAKRLPLRHQLFSYAKYRSRDGGRKAVLLDVIKSLIPHVPEQAVWVFDSGFDDFDWFRALDELGLQWVVRLKLAGKRKLMFAGGLVPVIEVAQAVSMSGTMQVRRYERRRRKNWKFSLGFLSAVGLPARTATRALLHEVERTFAFVMAEQRGRKRDPIVLATSCNVESSSDARDVVNNYFQRWAVEECHRFCKSMYGLEDIRLLTWTGLSRMLQFAMWAYGFVGWLAVAHGPSAKLIAQSAKAFGPVPYRYPHYRILAGVSGAMRDALRERSGT